MPDWTHKRSSEHKVSDGKEVTVEKDKEGMPDSEVEQDPEFSEETLELLARKADPNSLPAALLD